MDKYFFNNCWNINHPTINFFTFEAFCVESFGHKCIVEHVQDGEIWSDEEYWGTIFYDFENDRYTYMSTYLSDGNEIEKILKNWMNNKENLDDIWDGKISEGVEEKIEDDKKYRVWYYSTDAADPADCTIWNNVEYIQYVPQEKYELKKALMNLIEILTFGK